MAYRRFRQERFGRSIFSDFTSAISGHRRTREDMRVGAPCSAFDRGPGEVYWSRDRVARTGARARRKIPRTTHSTGPPTWTTRQKLPATVETADARATYLYQFVESPHSLAVVLRCRSIRHCEPPQSQRFQHLLLHLRNHLPLCLRCLLRHEIFSETLIYLKRIYLKTMQYLICHSSTF